MVQGTALLLPPIKPFKSPGDPTRTISITGRPSCVSLRACIVRFRANLQAEDANAASE
jgi:hypothetical protein